MLYFHTSHLKKDKDAETILRDSRKMNDEVMGVEFGWGVDLEHGVGGGSWVGGLSGTQGSTLWPQTHNKPAHRIHSLQFVL